MIKPDINETLLVFNCHEAWVHQLGELGFSLDIIVQLKGQYKQTWDENIRPVPDNARLINLNQAIESKTRYYCIITHNFTDLLEIKSRIEPRLIVLHSTLEGRSIEENSAIKPEQMRNLLEKYMELTGIHAVAGTQLKAKSWNLTNDIVVIGCNPDDYIPCSGENPCGIRVCNFINSRKKILLWDFYQKAFDKIPVQLIGHNPGIDGAYPSKNWQHL